MGVDTCDSVGTVEGDLVVRTAAAMTDILLVVTFLVTLIRCILRVLNTVTGRRWSSPQKAVSLRRQRRSRS